MNYINRKDIANVQGLVAYIADNSEWADVTVRNVVTALGFRSNGGPESLKRLSGYLTDCARHGAQGGYPGFTFYSDTLAFFRLNRRDIVKNLELAAKESGEDITGKVQNFGVFRYDTPPAADDISRALWGTGALQEDLTALYNVFAWFCTENSAWRRSPASGTDTWRITRNIMRDCPHNTVTRNPPARFRG